MPRVKEATVLLAPTACGVTLYVSLLPRAMDSDAPLLLDGEAAAQGEHPVPATQLLEGAEYFYEWRGLPAKVNAVTAEPVEVFQPDDPSGLRGRLRPGLHTGTLTATLIADCASLGNLELEVRARKLTYRQEYRWMLRDIANQVTELVMDRFAVSGLRYRLDTERDAITLYERFAFLRELITSQAFESALAQIVRRPHVSWEQRHELVRPGAPIKADSYVLRQLAGGGGRVRWPAGPLPSLPTFLDRRKIEATQDTTPNRFVKFALQRWREVVLHINEALARAPESSIRTRGLRETSSLIENLDTILVLDLFRDLGELARFPSDSQVLQRREGYREVFRAYLEFELAARLSWVKNDEDYLAGQRDVATLYEYWVFLQVADIVAELVGQSFDLRPLVGTSEDGLNLSLRAGSETVVEGSVERRGRRLRVELCFNRTFASGATGSWTRPMRPDFALVISAQEGESAGFEPIVLLFDAKYKVDFASELFGTADEVAIPDSVDVRLGRGVLRSDLLKMHAYHDAIRRAAGAYVLYPGAEDPGKRESFREFHELLPGLGAFVLRPTPDGQAIGVAALRAFVDQVLDHVATRLSQHERGRYWIREVYQPLGSAETRNSQAAISKPLSTTPVLLGFVKSREHWNWIMEKRTYNLRTIGRLGGVEANADMLRSRFLLLYCPAVAKVVLARIVSDPELVTKVAMQQTGYPEPRGDYLCVQWGWAGSQEWLMGLRAEDVDRLVQQRGPKGAPAAVVWKDIEYLVTSSPPSLG
jgi:predicted component of viral defense system (DUF524 family)